MIARLLAILAVAWALGFAVFMLAMPGALEGSTTDAIVVPTGARGGSIAGSTCCAATRRSGCWSRVAPGVDAAVLAKEYHAPAALFACCIDLGGEAVDTRSNAEETVGWVREHRYTSVRLVTSDWHLPRARMELAAALGKDVVILGDGVPGNPRLAILVNEYDKLLLRRVALWLG